MGLSPPRFSIFRSSRSRQTTSFLVLARQVPVTSPTYPVPTMVRRMRVFQKSSGKVDASGAVRPSGRREQLVEVGDGLEQPFTELNGRLPTVERAASQECRLAARGSTCGSGLTDGRRPGELERQLRQLRDRELGRVAEVDRPRGLVLLHHAKRALHQIVHVAEGSGSTIAVKRDGLPRRACTTKFDTTRPSFISIRGP